MSHPNIVLGSIEEAYPSYRPADLHFFRDANDAVLATVPADDTWPPLCRAMLSVTGDDELHGSFRGRRLIGVHAHLNNVSGQLGSWLDKFDRLLALLYWTSAEVFVLHSDLGECRLIYRASRASIAGYSGALPKPPSEWQLSAFKIDSCSPCDPLVHAILRGRRGFVEHS